MQNRLLLLPGCENILEKYKDERSEFIANITSSQVSQSFMFYNDIIRPFIENTLLIDNIAANEGISYFEKTNGTFSRKESVNFDYKEDTLSQLVVRVFIHKSLYKSNSDYESSIQNISAVDIEKKYRTDLSDIPPDFIEQKNVYECKWINGEYKKFDSLSIPYYLFKTDLVNQFYECLELKYPDLEISLPGGLGKHLIYSLLENYIRNTAKHAYMGKHADKPFRAGHKRYHYPVKNATTL